MTLPRILSAVGRTLAVLGVVMLLFVVFQLWGTGLQQAQAQNNLESDLAERFRQAAAAGPAVPEVPPPAAAAPAGPEVGEPPSRPATAVPAAPAAEGPEPAGSEEGAATADESSADTPAAPASAPETGTAGAPAEPVAPDPPAAALPELPSLPSVVSHISEPAAARAVARLLDPAVEELLPLVYPEAGEAIARIIIPSIDVDTVVVAGVEIDDLRKGPGHYSTTPLPGQPGNAAIAGHRTTYGAPFGRLAELNAGDAIIVETLQGTFTYRVLPGMSGMAGHALGFRIVAPTALEVLDDLGDNRLTLTTCHPKYSSRQRLIVQAALVDDPVVRLPRPGEPIGAEYVELAEPAGPPPVPLVDSPPQAPDPPEANAPETLGAGEDEQASTGPGTAPEPAGAAATVDDATAGSAATGDPGGDGAPEQGAAPQAAEAAGPTAPRAPVTEVGFGEGLSGDRGAILPAVLWGLAAAAVWGLGRSLGRSGRRPLRYTVAAVPFLVVIYVMFTYVDRALPAY